MGIKEWFGNAFSSPSEKSLTKEQLQREEALFDRIAEEVVSRGLTVPALMFLEMHAPLGYVASQFTHSLGPFAALVVKQEDITAFAEAIGRRDGIEKLIRTIDYKEHECTGSNNADTNDSQQNAEREV